jgi:hypothetical protein
MAIAPEARANRIEKYTGRLLPVTCREIGQVLLDHRHVSRVRGRFQVFLQLGCFGIWLTFDFIDLHQQEVCPEFALRLVDLNSLQRALLCFGQRCKPKDAPAA